ncbi:hypothetical protein [Streptomyces sp. NPDC002133]|uniref:hypothetical protein n=1 Tax=Streptomyces sp. NPDC002133 TaxID=3154409 RepID=UPI00331D358A
MSHELVDGRFRIGRVIGRGNMGEVHQTEDLHLPQRAPEHTVAVKTIRRIVRRKDEAKYGTYRTKELILAEYDRMAAAGLTLENPLVDGENYTSTLTSPPGQGPRHEGAGE